MVRRSLFLVISVLMLMGASDPHGLDLREARLLRQARRYDEARQAYQGALQSGLCDPVRRDALFELGTCYQADRYWDEAISLYKQFLAELRPVPEDDPDFVRGQWKLAECLFEKGSYRLALEAMRVTRGHSIHSLCGNGEMEHHYQQALREAVLEEYVGEYDATVSGYFTIADSAVGLRLLALYETTGQLPDLIRLVQEEDRRYDERIRKYRQVCRAGGYCPPEHSTLYQTIHGILGLRDLEEAGDWQGLLSMLEPERPGGGWDHPDHELREAARLLARHPAETLRLLLPKAPRRGYYAYALGLTGSPEALAALKEEAREEKNYNQLLTLVDDLLAAGQAGAAALESLYPGAQENLKLLIDRYRQGILHDSGFEPHRDYLEFPFPPIAGGLRLPNHCAFHGAPTYEWVCGFKREAETEANGESES